MRFIQDPVAVAGTNDDLYMDMRNLSSVAAMPKKPGDFGTERRNPIIFDRQTKRFEKRSMPPIADDPHPGRFEINPN